MNIRSCLLLLAVVAMIGCGGEFQTAPVSGTITLDGKPLADVEIVFAPMETEGNINPGPASLARTDEDGKYELKLATGGTGAVVTRHRVGISYGEVSEEAVAAKMDAAINKNRDMSQREYEALERQVNQEMANPKKLPASYNDQSVIQFVVPSGGTDQANFDLKSDGSWDPN